MIGKKNDEHIDQSNSKKLTKAEADKARLQDEFHRLRLDESTPLFLASKKVTKYARILKNLQEAKRELEEDMGQ